MSNDNERLDKWLFHARFYRTRVLAQGAARSGKVRLNGARVEKAAQLLRPGDILTMGKGVDVVAVKVLALATRRGSAPQARLLYEIIKD